MREYPDEWPLSAIDAIERIDDECDHWRRVARIANLEAIWHRNLLEFSPANKGSMPLYDSLPRIEDRIAELRGRHSIEDLVMPWLKR
jgi:hypothetical protein